MCALPEFSDIVSGSVQGAYCPLVRRRYSVRSAVTGSLFAAFREGISPPSSVSRTLKAIRMIAPLTGQEGVDVVGVRQMVNQGVARNQDQQGEADADEAGRQPDDKGLRVKYLGNIPLGSADGPQDADSFLRSRTLM